MRIPIAVSLLALGSLLLGCNSNSTPRPADSSNVGRFGPATQGYVPGATTGRRPVAAPASFTWHQRLADAQAEARRTGRLILCLSTKPGCTLCEKFKNQILPQTRDQVAPMAVGYVYDIRRPEVPQVDQTLRANLKGASLMPLVGFLTPELRWVHGFWGPTDASKFSGDIRTARRIYPVRTASIQPAAPLDTGAMVAVVNEFGEREWSLPGDVWPVDAPEPEDAITGRPLPSGRVPPGTGAAMPGAPRLADATPPTSAPDPLAAPGGAPSPLPALPAPRDPLPIQPTALPPAPEATPPSPVQATPAPAAAADAEPRDLDAWGEETLKRALGQIQIGDYDGARRTLAEISRRLPNSTIARQAAKGSVAIYNHKKVREMSGVEREQVLARAQRDLGETMWGVLFSS